MMGVDLVGTYETNRVDLFLSMSTLRKTSTTGHILVRKKKVTPTRQDLSLFEQLKALLLPYKDRLELKVNTADHYELWTNEGYRTTSLHPVNKRGIQFAAIMIYAEHITFYFQPLYLDAILKEGLTESLKPFFRGKSCFYLKALTEQLCNDLKELLQKGWESYQKMGLVLRD